MARYRSKPSEIEAVQWTGDNLHDVDLFMHADGATNMNRRLIKDFGGPLRILAGKGGAQEFVPVPIGHWVVRPPGDFTDHWPVDPDYFAAKYEAVA